MNAELDKVIMDSLNKKWIMPAWMRNVAFVASIVLGCAMAYHAISEGKYLQLIPAVVIGGLAIGNYFRLIKWDSWFR